MFPEKMNSKLVARINNKIMYAQNKLSPIQQRIIVYMAAYIAKTDSSFRFYRVPVPDLAKAVAPKYEWKNIYTDLFDILDDLCNKRVRFYDDQENSNSKGRIINWLASGEICRTDANSPWVVELEFSDKMKPYLLKLAGEFSEIPYSSFVQLQSNHAIAIYKLIKANYWAKNENGQEKVKKNQFKISIEKLRFITDTEDTYKRYVDFKRRVLKKAAKECKEKMDLYFVFNDKLHRNNKNQVTEIVFTVFKNEAHQPVEFKFPPLSKSEAGIRNVSADRVPDYMSDSQKRATQILIEYGVNHRLAPILVEQHCGGSEIIGNENFYVQFVLDKIESSRKKRIQEVKKGLHNKPTTPDDKKGGLVKSALEKNHYFSEFMEYLSHTRKQATKTEERSGFTSTADLLNDMMNKKRP